MIAVEAERGAHACAEHGEAARDEGGVSAVGPHRAHQGLRAGVDLDAVADALEQRRWQAREQGDPAFERGREVEFTAHRARGDRGDLVTEPRDVGQLVDQLVGDDRRLHVGDEQLLAPRDARLAAGRRRRRGRRPVAPAPPLGRRGGRRARSRDRKRSSGQATPALRLVRRWPRPGRREPRARWPRRERGGRGSSPA